MLNRKENVSRLAAHVKPILQSQSHHLFQPSGGDRLDSPVVMPPAPPAETTENVSGRVDQEVQTDFVNPPSPQQHVTSGMRTTEVSRLVPTFVSILVFSFASCLTCLLVQLVAYIYSSLSSKLSATPTTADNYSFMVRNRNSSVTFFK